MSHKTLLLVDGSALMHRAYHAMPALTDKQGRPTGALYGFVKMLLRAVKDLQPHYVIVALDRKEPTFRKKMFIGYQAQRPEMEPELGQQFDRVRDLLVAMEIPVFDRAGFEADDLIGSISHQVVTVSKTNDVGPEKVLILTGDKDLMQLVNEQVHLLVPLRGTSNLHEFNAEEVEKKLGVRPDQVVDYKALVGDPSDNYPGVKGIGPKSAQVLLDKYQNFENIYQHVDEIKSSYKKKLVEHQEAAELSQKLAQIKLDMKDIDIDWEKAQSVIRQPGKLASTLTEFGFNTLAKQMGLEEEVGDGAEQLSLI